MALVAPDLRPRGPVELYDAAIHLCLRGRTALPALSLAGAVLPALSGQWLVYLALHGKPFGLAAAVFAAGLMLRSVFVGAASLAGQAALEGAPVGPYEALRTAFRRAPSLMSAGGMLFLIGWLVTPVTLWLGLTLWAPLHGAHALVARGEAGPFSMGRACRARLGREPNFLVRVLHLFAIVVVLVNLHTGIAAGLYLGRTLIGLDTAFLERFGSLDNGVYLAFLVALAFVALEPVKTALGLLLLVDARVRSEGLDLLAATERLSSRHLKSAAVALFAIASLASPAGRAWAQAESDAASRLENLAARLEIDSDPHVRKGLEAAGRLEGPEALALRRFAEQAEAGLQDGELDAVTLASRLKGALEEARGAAAPRSVRLDARKVARSILARPEFDAPESPASVDEERESLLAQFLRWLFGRTEKPDQPEAPRRCGLESQPLELGGGVKGGTFEVLTPVLVGLAIVAVVWLIVALLRRDWRPRPGLADGAGAGGAEAVQEEILSALAKPPEGWTSEADRLAARGEFREAVRALYLAVLSALHRRGEIDYDPFRSNWDYVRAFKGGAQDRPALRSLTLRFDYAWYGRSGATADGYALTRELARSFLEREARADA